MQANHTFCTSIYSDVRLKGATLMRIFCLCSWTPDWSAETLSDKKKPKNLYYRFWTSDWYTETLD